MPTAQTKLEVCNLALDLIREAPAASLETASAPLRWLLRNYDHTVDVTLRSYPWNFAKQRHLLSADAATPGFRWAYRYSFPNGALRILPVVRYRTDLSVIDIPHEIVGTFIETNEAAPLPVTVIRRVENPGEWDPLFVEIVRTALAMGLSNKFTGKTRYLELARELNAMARAKAEEIDTFEGSAESIEQHDIIRARE